MRKLITILLVLIMAPSLVACSSGESKAPSGQTASAPPAQESQAKDTPAPSSKPCSFQA